MAQLWAFVGSETCDVNIHPLNDAQNDRNTPGNKHVHRSAVSSQKESAGGSQSERFCAEKDTEDMEEIEGT